MSDSGKYINTYIDNAISVSHDFMVQVIQLKTQLKIANDLVLEKDQVISTLTKEKDDAVTNLTKEKEQISNSLQAENERYKGEIQGETEKLRLAQEEVSKAAANARLWEDQFNAMKNKVSHIDALSNQLNEMKQTLIAKNSEVEQLKKNLEDKDLEINNLKKKDLPKKNINTKGKPKPIVPTVEETDDF